MNDIEATIPAVARLTSPAVDTAVALIEEIPLRPLTPDEPAPFAPSRAVLALLVGCYARQIYRSEEAAALAARNPAFPWPWWAALPDAKAFRRFRRQNTGAIRRCLAETLRLLAEQKVAAGSLTKADASQFTEEARRRITMAVFTDSMELEGE